ncbi:hypothetical protein A1O3_02831 [Capronia epimyces CBS 606.96]|uniref:Zn(2)-C6 fungal-type domain-containing protein n=1 Tax=Capronia epimyces CBS 606.96 TaxID=1182542 RepID=W9Z5I0_9EURO|nr:uncharacterized protein A1O3_02831 [Capronia epimyces CBS 606.96]EXJ89764.1 hypothetical protein A1O3_02831 [Capronia epimyces CBS 606.96]
MDPADSHVSETFLSPRPETTQQRPQALERTASEAETHPNRARQPKSVKRRASQACQSCRARKVRCNVAKHGAPCIHCRLDEIECIIGESKRKRKRTTNGTSSGSTSNNLLPSSAPYEPLPHLSQHVVPQSLEQRETSPKTPPAPSYIFYNFQPLGQQTAALPESMPFPHGLASPTAAPPLALPAYIKPLPDRFGPDDITYLQNKGALAIPDQELRNELLRSYAEYMHPFMPLLDFHKFVRIVDQNDGMQSVSLLLFQAVMFTGIATVDMRFLKAAGYSTRREARRAFFDKTRLLYDLDYEDDSIALIQALLLMTYWREDPNGRKETHYWIGIAVSLAHKIGLQRNPEQSTALEPWRQKLYKRIWWSAYMRDSQIALGTRRSTRMTRMKDVDFDVPMLQLADFELDTLPDGPCCIPADCKVVRDMETQRQLAVMCIEMAKLSMCISHILSVQYGITNSKASTWTATMLFAESLQPGDDQIQASAKALQEWKGKLPEAAQYITPTRHDVDSGNGCLVLNRAFLHMVYYTALSSLHRSQLPPWTGTLPRPARATVVDVSHEAVRLAATKITEIVGTLDNLDLVRYLPSPSITVLLHAIVIHLLDVLAPEEFLRRTSLQDFCKCMQIMAALRDMYAAADYSTAFLQAAIQRTEIGPVTPQKDEDRENCTSTQGLTGTGLRLHPAGAGPGPESGQLARPPTDQVMELTAQQTNGPLGAPTSDAVGIDGNIDRRLDFSLMSANPLSDRHFQQRQPANHVSHCPPDLVFDAMDVANDPSAMVLNSSNSATMVGHGNDFELNFDSTTNLGAGGKMFNVDEGDFGAVQGDSGGFSLETDWLMEMGAEGLMLGGR